MKITGVTTEDGNQPTATGGETPPPRSIAGMRFTQLTQLWITKHILKDNFFPF